MQRMDEIYLRAAKSSWHIQRPNFANPHSAAGDRGTSILKNHFAGPLFDPMFFLPIDNTT